MRRDRDDDFELTTERECPDCFSLPGVAHSPKCGENRERTNRAILARVDAYYRGGLVVAFKSHDEGRPNEPMTYLYRSTLLDILGVDEDDPRASPAPRPPEDGA
jgi:hypothetical protein